MWPFQIFHLPGATVCLLRFKQSEPRHLLYVSINLQKFLAGLEWGLGILLVVTYDSNLCLFEEHQFTGYSLDCYSYQKNIIYTYICKIDVLYFMCYIAIISVLYFVLSLINSH